MTKLPGRPGVLRKEHRQKGTKKNDSLPKTGDPRYL
jgi:hypothetical protein